MKKGAEKSAPREKKDGKSEQKERKQAIKRLLALLVQEIRVEAREALKPYLDEDNSPNRIRRLKMLTVGLKKRYADEIERGQKLTAKQVGDALRALVDRDGRQDDLKARDLQSEGIRGKTAGLEIEGNRWIRPLHP